MRIDHTDDSPALALWRERLEPYLDVQGGVEALRARIQPNLPWPDVDNPMVGYLVARAGEIHEQHWAATHVLGHRSGAMRADPIVDSVAPPIAPGPAGPRMLLRLKQAPRGCGTGKRLSASEARVSTRARTMAQNLIDAVARKPSTAPKEPGRRRLRTLPPKRPPCPGEGRTHPGGVRDNRCPTRDPRQLPERE